MQPIIQSGNTKIIIGRMRHRIQIVDTTNLQDSTGGYDINKSNVVINCWATIEALTASEKFAAHEFVSQVTHKVMIRNPRNSITNGRPLARMQVWFNKRQFQIEGVLNPTERPDMLILMCIEIDDSLNQPTAASMENAI